MQIQWFPGHMHKARLQIKEAMPRVDLFIEVLDARIPYSSENPMLGELRGQKPVLKLLAKSDLADPKRTRQWLAYLDQQSGTSAISISTKDPGRIRNLSQLCREILPQKQPELQTITTMIVGIPNVGKSTLINILAGRPVAKTGNEPAVTKGQQRINIGDGITLMDTPGVLWPNVENPSSGLRLATIGSIKDTAMDYEDVAWFAAKYMLPNYPEGLRERYDIELLPTDATEFLELIGRKRGCLGRSGVVDFDRASRIFLNELLRGDAGPAHTRNSRDDGTGKASSDRHSGRKGGQQKKQESQTQGGFQSPQRTISPKTQTAP